MQKKYVSLSKLSTFLDNLKTTFAALGHKHTINDLTDYTVDTELSDTSTNPVANSTIKTAIDEVKTYADEHDALMFEVTYNSDDKTYSLADVTFDELNSYALQNKMVILRYNTAMFHFIRSVQSSDDTISLYYSQMYSDKHYYFRIKSDGSVGYYSTNLMRASSPTGTGSLSMNRNSSSSTGSYSSTLGYNNTASGISSHAEGTYTTASGSSSHAEGTYTTASGSSSHAEGTHTTAHGSYSHAEGYYTTASGSVQHVQGKFNVDDNTNLYVHIVGNGNENALSNAHTLDWNGNAWFAGDVYVGSTSGTNKDDGSVKLATMDDVEASLDAKADTNHTHNDVYYTETEVDEKIAVLNNSIASKANSSHNHDSAYDAIGSADTALASAKSYTDTKTSGLASTSAVDSKISTHNTSTSAHNDIRVLISDLTTKLNNFLDVDDTTTDQLSEVLDLINNNKGTLESLTTSKINVSDIVNNLTTNSTSKVLSAAQGVTIKSLIDALQAELDSHTHDIADVTGLQTALDSKAASSHGTHVSYSTTVPVMDGAASVGTASTVARSDHKHPTDTSRASQTDLDALEAVVSGKANASHTHTIANVTNLQSTLDAKATQTDLDTHTANTTVHITSTERTNWNAAKTHADSAHAPSNAEKNQNAFSNIAVGSTSVAADSATDTVTFVGSNMTITPDATNDKITFSVADGSTSTKGVVQLTNSTSSTSTTTAATPNSVKSAYDLANTANTAAATAQDTADSKVPLSRTVNGKALSANIILAASDVNAYSKTEIDEYVFITTDDIDEICNASIQSASELTF